MNNVFSGRAAPLLVQSSRVWINIIVLSSIAALTFGVWGCPGFHRGTPELTRWAVLTAFLANTLNMSVIPGMVPQLFAEDKWTPVKEILYNSWIILSGFLLTGISPWLSGQSFSTTELWYSMVVPGIWGLTISATVVNQMVRYRKNTRHAQRIQSGIRKRNRLSGDKDRDFSLPVSLNGIETAASAYAIVYLRNTGDQAAIAFQQKSGVSEGRSAGDFKTIRESVRRLSNFYRCHRDWVVNMDKVTGVRADALGFHLETEMTGILIPVSSSLNGDLEGRLMK